MMTVCASSATAVGVDDDHYCFDVVAAGLDGFLFAELGPLCLPLPLFAIAIASRTKDRQEREKYKAPKLSYFHGN